MSFKCQHLPREPPDQRNHEFSIFLFSIRAFNSEKIFMFPIRVFFSRSFLLKSELLYSVLSMFLMCIINKRKL